MVSSFPQAGRPDKCSSWWREDPEWVAPICKQVVPMSVQPKVKRRPRVSSSYLQASHPIICVSLVEFGVFMVFKRRKFVLIGPQAAMGRPGKSTIISHSCPWNWQPSPHCSGPSWLDGGASPGTNPFLLRKLSAFCHYQPAIYTTHRAQAVHAEGHLQAHAELPSTHMLFGAQSPERGPREQGPSVLALP